MREWLKRHRREFNPGATAVISLDNLAAGEAAYAVKEGAVFASRMHPTLVEIASEIGGTSYDSDEISDAYLARSAGLPTLRLSTTESQPEPDADAFKRTCEFAGALLDRIDAEIGPRLG
jgi:hypothetical protein